KGGYRTGFGVLLIPALVCLGILVVARFLHPRPQELEELSAQPLATRYLTPTYWIYLGGGALIAAGFADFALIGFHFHKAHAVPMASSALAALLFGRLFDKFGGNIALFAFFISAASAPFVFLGTSFFALIGMILWGIGMSAQGSLLQAMLTAVIPAEKRSTAFGLFDTGYGIAWFLGSAKMGLLFVILILDLGWFSLFVQF